mmetsp:Transcript_30256/g.69279  ORF Transcript_30256/g.69279 Transcript_30256/m.69279 type:complete len:261 (+) Transcript_30256:114-896(+)
MPGRLDVLEELVARVELLLAHLARELVVLLLLRYLLLRLLALFLLARVPARPLLLLLLHERSGSRRHRRRHRGTLVRALGTPPRLYTPRAECGGKFVLGVQLGVQLDGLSRRGRLRARGLIRVSLVGAARIGISLRVPIPSRSLSRLRRLALSRLHRLLSTGLAIPFLPILIIIIPLVLLPILFLLFFLLLLVILLLLAHLPEYFSQLCYFLEVLFRPLVILPLSQRAEILSAGGAEEHLGVRLIRSLCLGCRHAPRRSL